MIMEGFTYLRPKTCTYLTNDGSGDKKDKGTRNCMIKQRFKFGSLSISCWRERVCFSYMYVFYVSFTVNLVSSNILLIWYYNMSMKLIDAHEETVLNKLTEPNSIQLLLKAEATPTAFFKGS